MYYLVASHTLGCSTDSKSAERSLVIIKSSVTGLDLSEGEIEGIREGESEGMREGEIVRV